MAIRCTQTSSCLRPRSRARAPHDRPWRARRQLATACAARRAGQCAAVVKANAYGIGLAEAAPALWAAGARVFFVAHLSEGVAARHVLPEAAIYVLNGLESHCRTWRLCRTSPRAGPRRRRRSLRAGPLSPRGAAGAPIRAASRHRHEPAGFRIARAGCGPRWRRTARERGRLADEPFRLVRVRGRPHQRRADRAVRGRPRGLPKPPRLARQFLGHVSYPPGRSTTWPGPAMRSMAAIRRPARPNPMRPVATLTVAIQQTRWIEAGETCGYNAQWTAKRRTRLATLLVGYADGLPRGAGATDAKPGAEVAIAGRRCPLVGRVSMDLTIVDVTDLPEDAARPGDRVELFGSSIDLDDFAARSGTIGYHVLTSPRAALPAGICRLTIGKDRGQTEGSMRFFKLPHSGLRGGDGLFGRRFPEGNDCFRAPWREARKGARPTRLPGLQSRPRAAGGDPKSVRKAGRDFCPQPRRPEERRRASSTTMSGLWRRSSRPQSPLACRSTPRSATMIQSA